MNEWKMKGGKDAFETRLNDFKSMIPPFNN